MDTIRVMTWNVWWRFGGNWQQRERGLHHVLSEVRPDLLGLQECWGYADTSQAEVLAEQLGMFSAFVRVGLPAEPFPVEEPTQTGATMGLGLLSRWPLRTVVAAGMPSADRHLSALVATVDHPRGSLRVVVGVTSFEPDRVVETSQQLETLERLVSAGGYLPGVLLADLNYDFEFTAMRELRLSDGWAAADAGADPITYGPSNRFADPAAKQQYGRRIDHVLCHPGQVGARAVWARIIRDEPHGFPPSDHYPVVVDIALP
jgi:endonuclease/exonuclease/phosphatase family metal-dependent hydrolase